MFTKRHEQELAEIKATTHDLVQRFEEILEQLERIKQNQDELAGTPHPPSDAPASTPGPKRSERRRRAQGATSAEGDGGGRPGKGRAGGRRRAGGSRKRRRAGDSDSTEE